MELHTLTLSITISPPSSFLFLMVFALGEGSLPSSLYDLLPLYSYLTWFIPNFILMTKTLPPKQVSSIKLKHHLTSFFVFK